MKAYLVSLVLTSLIGCGTAVDVKTPTVVDDIAPTIKPTIKPTVAPTVEPTPAPTPTIEPKPSVHRISACNRSWFDGTYTSFSNAVKAEYGDNWTTYVDVEDGEYKYCSSPYSYFEEDYMERWTALTFDGKVTIYQGCGKMYISEYGTICNGKPLKELPIPAVVTEPTIDTGPTCTKGKRCGDSCIALDKVCHK
jgi:hypothetical protein